MTIVFLWALGAIVSNVLMDVMTMVRFTEVKPSLYGVLYTAINAWKLNVPKPFKYYNIYFSLMLTWGMAFIALFVIIILIATRNAKNGKTKEG